MQNHENHDFPKIFIFPKIFLEVTWGIGGMRTRAWTAPGGLLRRLRRPQGIARGAEVCAMGAGRVDSVTPNPKKHAKT